MLLRWLARLQWTTIGKLTIWSQIWTRAQAAMACSHLSLYLTTRYSAPPQRPIEPATRHLRRKLMQMGVCSSWHWTWESLCSSTVWCWCRTCSIMLWPTRMPISQNTSRAMKSTSETTLTTRRTPSAQVAPSCRSIKIQATFSLTTVRVG